MWLLVMVISLPALIFRNVKNGVCDSYHDYDSEVSETESTYLHTLKSLTVLLHNPLKFVVWVIGNFKESCLILLLDMKSVLCTGDSDTSLFVTT